MRASVKAWLAEMRLRIKHSEQCARDSVKLAKAQRKLADTLRAEYEAAKKGGLR